MAPYLFIGKPGIVLFFLFSPPLSTFVCAWVLPLLLPVYCCHRRRCCRRRWPNFIEPCYVYVTYHLQPYVRIYNPPSSSIERHKQRRHMLSTHFKEVWFVAMLFCFYFFSSHCCCCLFYFSIIYSYNIFCAMLHERTHTHTAICPVSC